MNIKEYLLEESKKLEDSYKESYTILNEEEKIKILGTISMLESVIKEFDKRGF